MSELFPFAHREIRVGSHDQRYVDEGSGTSTLLCVHGNPTWSFYYRSVIQRFSDRYRVIAVDHLGCGRSDKPSRNDFAYTLSAHRDNLIRLIDQLDVQNITLVAHDWGGAIGLATLLERVERFDRVVLLNTGAFPPPYIPWRIAACRIPLLGTFAVRQFNAFARAAITMAMSRQKLTAAEAAELLSPYDSWANRVAIDSFVRDIPMKPSHPTYPVLEKLQSDLPKLAEMPSALIWGMKDWCFRPDCLHRFQRVWPQAQVTEISDAGHYVLEDATEDVLEAIESFLASTESSDETRATRAIESGPGNTHG